MGSDVDLGVSLDNMQDGKEYGRKQGKLIVRKLV
jgi:hypothetical protein